jgi:hypothetical protein
VLILDRMALARYVEVELTKAAALSGPVDTSQTQKWCAELRDAVRAEHGRSLPDARANSLWHRCADAACKALISEPATFGPVLRGEGVLAVLHLASRQASERAREFHVMATHHEELRSCVRRIPVASAPVAPGTGDADEEAAWRAAITSAAVVSAPCHDDSITSAAEIGPVLAVYARAAERVGRREWAQASNEWMIQQIRSYFRGHRVAAARDGRGMSLLATGDGSERRLKLLDVGSCHDPLRAWSDELQMDVTAIDLHPSPTAPLVQKCDFLELELLPAGSSPITASEMQDVGAQALRALPCAAFDVVVFSLVLSYLPTAALRHLALTKARALLVPGGLLLVVDPKSIAPGGAARGSGPRDSGRMGRQEFKLDELPPILQGWVHALVPVGLELMHYNRVTQTHCLVFRAVPPPGPREMPGSSSVGSPGQHAAGLPIAWDEGRSVQTCDAVSSKKRSQRRALAKAEAENLLACAPRAPAST